MHYNCEERTKWDGWIPGLSKSGAFVQQQVEDGEQEDSAEETAIREIDRHVGIIYSALLPDSLLVVCSCQGNTASSRILFVRYKPSPPGMIICEDHHPHSLIYAASMKPACTLRSVR